MTVTVVLALFMVLLVLGAPVFLAMGLSGLLGAWWMGETHGLLQNAGQSLYQTFSQYDLIAVPLYILVGTLMERAQLSQQLFSAARAWVGGLRGGLGVATVAACTLFAAISGSSVATAATIGLVAMPALAERGYKPEFSGALVAAGGTLGILIPPSIAMIVFGVITEQSISALFMAGVVPGLLLAAMFAAYTAWAAKESAPAANEVLPSRWAATKASALALALPLFIFVAIYSGLATPTEVAALAVAYVLVVGMATRALKWPAITEAFRASARFTAMIFLLIGFGKLFTEFFTLIQLPQRAAELVTQSGWPPLVVVTLIIVLLLVLGMFLESLSMLLITVPILFPIVKALGIDPLAFGVFMVLAVEAGLITPPVGMNLFTLCSIGKIDFAKISREVLPYLLMMVVVMYLVVFFSGVATWLPGTMSGAR
jgi:C4-dicarboxylate transporter DctM subunit